MIVQCDKCGTKYNVSEEKVPEEGIKAKCKGCGHVMMLTRPSLEVEPELQPAPTPSPQQAWQCVCGTTNVPEAEHCSTCKRPKKLFTSLSASPKPPEQTVQQAPQELARSSVLPSLRNILLMGALAVILGIGISYALGYAVNQSISTFLTTVFK